MVWMEVRNSWPRRTSLNYEGYVKADSIHNTGYSEEDTKRRRVR